MIHISCKCQIEWNSNSIAFLSIQGGDRYTESTTCVREGNVHCKGMKERKDVNLRARKWYGEEVREREVGKINKNDGKGTENKADVIQHLTRIHREY